MKPLEVLCCIAWYIISILWVNILHAYQLNDFADAIFNSLWVDSALKFSLLEVLTSVWRQYLLLWRFPVTEWGFLLILQFSVVPVNVFLSMQRNKKNNSHRKLYWICPSNLAQKKRILYLNLIWKMCWDFKC